MRYATPIIMGALLLPTIHQAADQPLPPIVRIRVTHQAFEPRQPWQKEKTRNRIGYGAVLDNGTILTTEHLIRSHQLVELTKARSDSQMELALLKPHDPADLQHLPSLALAESIPDDASLQILQLDETRELQRGDGTVIRVLVERLPHAPANLLLFKILTDLNVDGEGAAVICDGQLAGLIVSYDRSSRTGMMIPCTVLKHFIDDCADGTYQGAASAGIIWSDLVDPAKRRFLGMNDTEGGIQIISCLPDTDAASVLRPNDVITHWDSHPIDNLGYYPDPVFGRLRFPHLIKGMRKPGDSVPVTIVRDAIQTNVVVKLARADDTKALIPENITAGPVPYLIEGGIVLRELTGRYLKAHGSEWMMRVDSRFAHIYNTQRMHPDQPGDRIVILDSVLPDTINIGYAHLRSQIVERVNGEAVRNMADVHRIANRDGFITRISLRAMGLDIVLDEESLPVANHRLMQQYRILSLSREDASITGN